MKRLADVACTGIGLLCLAPVLALIALAILVDDGRPILFSQLRVGRNGKGFKIWKFRTMRVGIPGSSITAARDVRVTRIGRLLRAFKLDELPQLFNVLSGDMSLIGPRPEVPEYVQFDQPLWPEILRVRPGITDLATLVHRNEEQILANFEDPAAAYREIVLPAKLRLNVTYLRSRSLWKDFLLISLSVRYSVFPGGFDANRVCEILNKGAKTNDKACFHPLSYSLDRRGGNKGGGSDSTIGMADHRAAGRAV